MLINSMLCLCICACVYVNNMKLCVSKKGKNLFVNVPFDSVEITDVCAHRNGQAGAKGRAACK